MSRLPERCDVVVAGGGPGGSAAATFLRQRGYDVVVLERKRHPRPNVGESMIPDCWKFFDLLGVTPKIEAENFLAKSGGIADWQGKPGRTSFRDHGYTRGALHVERDILDRLLFEHAGSCGAAIFEDVQVEKITWVEEHQVRTDCLDHATGERHTITSKYVVDATGRAALLARANSLRMDDDDFDFAAIWGYFENSNYIAGDGSVHHVSESRDFPPATCVTALPGDESGWSWHIVLRDSTSVGLVMPMTMLKEGKKHPGGLERYFLDRCFELPRLATLLADARYIEDSLTVIRNYSFRCDQVTMPGCFMVGDAAGFVDPIFSIGVTLSFYGAYAAAWAIDRCIRNPSRVAATRAIYEHQLANRVEFARSLARPAHRAREDSAANHETARLFMPRERTLIEGWTAAVGRPNNYRKAVGR